MFFECHCGRIVFICEMHSTLYKLVCIVSLFGMFVKVHHAQDRVGPIYHRVLLYANVYGHNTHMLTHTSHAHS